MLQAIGWIVYARLFVRRIIRPNAASSFMFAYGTALMVLLEVGSGASWHVLALPMTCTIFSCMVAALCLRRGATEPVDGVEAIAFSADVWLTIFWGAIAFGYGDIGPYAAGFVVAGNITTLTAFFPVLRSTLLTPEREQPAPWCIWTLAYIALTVTTILADQGQHPELLIYPTLNAFLHGTIALLALHGKPRRSDWVDKARTIYIGHSRIHGAGMFAGQHFAPGDVLWQLSGKVIFGAITEDGPNYIGLGPDVWIDPISPLDHINHHCTPNAAFGAHRQLRALRIIHPGEEITLDYSTTEADPNWWMKCECQSADCRRVLYAIQRSFADHAAPPMASPLMQLVWRKRHDRYKIEGYQPIASQSLPELPEPLSARTTPSPRRRSSWYHRKASQSTTRVRNQK
jgi:hypothetical protein